MKNFILTLLLVMMTTSSFAFTSSECAQLKADLDVVAARMKYVNASKQKRDLTKQSLINSKKWVERKYEAMKGVKDLPYVGALVGAVFIYIKTENASLATRGLSIVAMPFLVALAGKLSQLIERASEGLPFERQADLKFIDEEIKELKEIDSQIDQGKTIDLIISLTKMQINLTYMSAQLSCEE